MSYNCGNCVFWAAKRKYRHPEKLEHPEPCLQEHYYNGHADYHSRWKYWYNYCIWHKEMTEYRVIVAGSRSFNDYDFMEDKLDYLLEDKYKTHNIIILSGRADGADKLGELFAHKHGLWVEYYPAKWHKHGKAAGPIRNKQMARVADVAVVFWDGISRGAKNMIDTMRSIGKLVRVVRF